MDFIHHEHPESTEQPLPPPHPNRLAWWMFAVTMGAVVGFILAGVGLLSSGAERWVLLGLAAVAALLPPVVFQIRSALVRQESTDIIEEEDREAHVGEG